MINETEVILHRGDRDDAAGNKARRHDASERWIVESYEARTTKAMLDAGAIELPSRIEGKLFEVDAQQLILFIASSSGLIVEFRRHKKRQYSEATKAKLAERLRSMRQQQKV